MALAGLGVTVRRDKRFKASKTALSDYAYSQLKGLWQDCVRAFVLETIEHIEVDTGMSGASLYGVAVKVKVGNQILETLRGKGPKRPHPAYTDISGRTHPGVKKSIELGKSLGRAERAYKILYGQASQPKLKFEFHITVFQYRLHEFGFQTAAWDSLEAGRQAFLDAWAENFSKRLTAKKILEFVKPKGSVSEG